MPKRLSQMLLFSSLLLAAQFTSGAFSEAQARSNRPTRNTQRAQAQQIQTRTLVQQTIIRQQSLPSRRPQGPQVQQRTNPAHHQAPIQVQRPRHRPVYQAPVYQQAPPIVVYPSRPVNWNNGPQPIPRNNDSGDVNIQLGFPLP
jgi:hypothetical protein